MPSNFSKDEFSQLVCEDDYNHALMKNRDRAKYLYSFIPTNSVSLFLEPEGLDKIEKMYKNLRADYEGETPARNANREHFWKALDSGKEIKALLTDKSIDHYLKALSKALNKKEFKEHLNLIRERIKKYKNTEYVVVPENIALKINISDCDVMISIRKGTSLCGLHTENELLILEYTQLFKETLKKGIPLMKYLNQKKV